MPATSAVQVTGSRARALRAVPDRADERRSEREERCARAEHDARPERVEEAAERGADDRGALPERRGPGDGIGEMRARHERRRHRLTRRPGEGARDPADDDERIDRPQPAGPRDDAGEQAERGRRVQAEAEADDQAPVDVVGDVARDERERDRRHEGGEADEAERERTAGEVVDEPADRDRLHLLREPARDARGGEQREVARAEGGEAGGGVGGEHGEGTGDSRP